MLQLFFVDEPCLPCREATALSLLPKLSTIHERVYNFPFPPSLHLHCVFTVPSLCL